ncbi:hypothetical protein Nepgr_015009 [Nepenthes gracilis]|uniref:BHLH domain-containing protein n=1 Tax=Nepenthes gracilis TaxID=150966 RepID=A0AAD3XQD4_NEPGR|nr:hypothetical protein Nepgr_015009 [Nepenthes gracilis]
MALEAVIYHQDLFGNNSKGDPFNSLLENWGSYLSIPGGGVGCGGGGGGGDGSYEFQENQGEDCHYGNLDLSPPLIVSSSETHVVPSGAAVGMETTAPLVAPPASAASAAALMRPKRQRRARRRKNREEIENQRMTHIAVERNRRKQMNEYLAVLRSLMPESYVQRGDQASIIGGAINFVKVLEQKLQFLSAQKHVCGGNSSSSPFREFCTFPQYSSRENLQSFSNGGSCRSGVADIEVTMVESHAHLKIIWKRRRQPKHLLKFVSGLQSLKLTILHVNVTTVDGVSLYALSVKVEDDSKLISVDEIASAVHQVVDRIQEEAN